METNKDGPIGSIESKSIPGSSSLTSSITATESTEIGPIGSPLDKPKNEIDLKIKSPGPTRTVTYSCRDCPCCISHYYAVQGDSGYNVSCIHPDAPPPASIGDSHWTTPKWCPVNKDTKEEARHEASMARDMVRGLEYE